MTLILSIRVMILDTYIDSCLLYFFWECKIVEINDYLKDELEKLLEELFKHSILQTNFYILFKLLV